MIFGRVLDCIDEDKQSNTIRRRVVSK